MKPFFQRSPSMPLWYEVLRWTMVVIGLAFLWYQPRSTVGGLYVGAIQLVLIPLIWAETSKERPWVRWAATLLLAAMAMAVFWTTLFGWPF